MVEHAQLQLRRRCDIERFESLAASGCAGAARSCRKARRCRCSRRSRSPACRRCARSGSDSLRSRGPASGSFSARDVRDRPACRAGSRPIGRTLPLNGERGGQQSRPAHAAIPPRPPGSTRLRAATRSRLRSAGRAPAMAAAKRTIAEPQIIAVLGSGGRQASSPPEETSRCTRRSIDPFETPSRRNRDALSAPIGD